MVKNGMNGVGESSGADDEEEDGGDVESGSGMDGPGLEHVGDE